MAKFFTSPNDLADWVREAGSLGKAVDAIINLPGVNRKAHLDVAETVKRIFSKADSENASEVLYEMLQAAGITEADATAAKEKADTAEAVDAMKTSGVITAEEHGKMIKEAQIMRQPGEYVMPLRFCPKLPKQSAGQGLISTYNCRHYCLDSIVLDEDPERVYCAEAMWRRHVMDKFSREWKDRENGKWVGGYINDRFHVFPTAGTPGNPDAPCNGGNQMELRPDERTRQPRPHQWSTERRLQEQREPNSTEAIVLSLAQPNVIKIAAVDVRRDGDVDEAFSRAIELRQAGMTDEDAAVDIATRFNIPVQAAVVIQSKAMNKLASHVSDAYEAEKDAPLKRGKPSLPTPKKTPKADEEVQEDAKALGLTE